MSPILPLEIRVGRAEFRLWNKQPTTVVPDTKVPIIPWAAITTAGCVFPPLLTRLDYACKLPIGLLAPL